MLIGFVLALTWANWFAPEFPVLVVAGAVALALSLALFWRNSRMTGASLIARIGIVGVGAVFLWLGFALSLPALFTVAVGTEYKAQMRVVSYGWGSGTCRFRLVLEDLAPPGGGFCRAGEEPSSFKPGQHVAVTGRRSALGVQVTGFVLVGAKNAAREG